jgi:hypothetical protein
VGRGEVRGRGTRLRTTSSSGIAICGITFAIAALAAGCAAARKKPAFPWQTATIVRPIVPAPETTDIAEPDVPAEAPDMDSGISVTLRVPVRPHVAAPPPPPERAPQPELPTIAPQLSPQESAAAQQDTNASLSATDKNLESARGKNLNPTQNDMLSKIRGFMADARQAAQEGDWTRARNLAKKAQVLSEELAKSLS